MPVIPQNSQDNGRNFNEFDRKIRSARGRSRW